ncbi:glutathione S-transferase [Physcia stellaris]|nr:glutathione S-transferase [Physcia stellaris]
MFALRKLNIFTSLVNPICPLVKSSLPYSNPLSQRPVKLSESLKMSTRGSKRQKTSASSDEPFELLYWPGLPGRGEPIRLCFEETGTPYKDVANEAKDGINAVLSRIDPDNVGEGGNIPPLAPPMLRRGNLLLSQLPNILLYLGPKLDLVPDEEDDPNGTYFINQLALTALDGLSNEPHDVHHPIAVGAYYEEQKEEAKKKAVDYIENRLPKFIGYFERVLKSEASKGGEWLYGGRLSYADLVLFHTVDGVTFAFPKAITKLKESGKYDGVFALVDRVRNRKNVKQYLESDRRQKYSMGIYRHYEELDLS